MLFDTNKPLSEFYNAPDFAKDAKLKARLKLLGFNPNGTPTAWGKIAGWIPGVGIAANLKAKHITQEAGAEDAAMNIGQMLDNNISKLGIVAGGAAAAAGAVTGNPQLIKTGIDLGLKSGTALAGDQNDFMGLYDGENYFF